MINIDDISSTPARWEQRGRSSLSSPSQMQVQMQMQGRQGKKARQVKARYKVVLCSLLMSIVLSLSSD